MPVIPGYQAVGVASPSGRAPFARRSGRSPVGEALGEVGQKLNRIGEEKYKQATDLATATAKNEYLRTSIDLANKVQEDPDYNTWQKQYEDGAKQAAATAGANIRDPIARQNFELEAQSEGIRTSATIAARAKQRFREAKVTGLNQSFEENQKALLATDDPEAQKSLMVGTAQLYDAAAADGTITPNQARAQKKSFVESFSKARADSLIPVARLDALQKGMKVDSEGRTTFDKNTGTFADFIPDEERMKMIKVAEAEHNQEIVAAEQAQRARSEAAYKKYVDQIIQDPTKLDIKAVSRDPDLSGQHGETLLRLYNEELKRLHGGADPDENKGPGFWNTYQMVIHGQITDPLKIYELAGQGKPLTMAGANALFEVSKKLKEGQNKGDYETQKLAKFDAEIHRKITSPDGIQMFGPQRNTAETNYTRAWFDSRKAIEAGKAKGLSLDEMLDDRSPNYIMKNLQAYVPAQEALRYPGTNPGEKFDLKTLDTQFKDGREGMAAGNKALLDAVAAYRRDPKTGISPEQAIGYALKRGWGIVKKPTVVTPPQPFIPPAR